MENFPIAGQISALSQAQSKLIDLGIEFGPRLFATTLILVAGYFIGRWVGGMLDRMLVRLGMDQREVRLLSWLRP